MLKKFITFTLIFISLNILSAETKAEAESKQNYLEVNAQNVQYLKEILTQSGLKVADLQSEVLNYLNEYKCFKLFYRCSTQPYIKCIFPNDNFIVHFDFESLLISDDAKFMTKLERNVRFDQLCTLANNYIAVTQNKIIQIYDPTLNKILKVLEGHLADVKSLCAWGDDKLISGSRDKTIKIWDLNSGKCIKTFKGYDDTITGLYLLQNNKLLAVYFSRRIQIFDIVSGECLETLSPRSDILCVLPNNKLAIALWDSIIILDIDSREVVCKLEGHSDCINTLCLLFNTLLVSGSRDGTIKIWDINYKKCIQTLNKTGEVHCLGSLSDGKFICINDYIYEHLIEVNSCKPCFDLTL